jgi:hypothetical protein
MAGSKVCIRCGVDKVESDFYLDRRRNRFYSHCKTCHGRSVRVWESAHKEKSDKNKKDWATINKEDIRRRCAEWHVTNRDRRLEYIRTYRRENRGICNALEAKRRASKLQRTPKWLTEDDKYRMKMFYITAKYMEWLHKIKFEVDHIVPLQGVEVSGLHVPWNLQLLTEEEHKWKGNRHG